VARPGWPRVDPLRFAAMPEAEASERAAPEARAEALARLDDLRGHWWHSIDLGDGVRTEGRKSAEILRKELADVDLPDVRGKSVLDIGAWDGFYSFEAERRGASRVVALDYFVWSLDLDAQHAYLARCHEEGRTPQPWNEVPEVWKPDTLPGKACFDTAVAALGSNVESVVADFLEVDLDALGTFDVVLFLGVLYHLLDPYAAVRRLAEVTNEVAIIETAAILTPGLEVYPLVAFFPEDELLGDPTNWWAPNAAALAGMCKAAGFSRVETKITASPPRGPRPAVAQRVQHARDAAKLAWGGHLPQGAFEHARMIAHAWK
jgi:tRNA (mo5U34)-methyltransferase